MPQGPPGPPGQLPSIEQLMPWLHVIFDAWEDYRKNREQEAAERGAMESREREAMNVLEDSEADGDAGFDFGDEHGKHKKKKDKKHKDKHKK